MSKTETRKLIAEVDTNQDGKLEKEVACTMHCYESHLYSNRSTMSNGEACASCVLIGVLALHSCIGLSLDCTHLCAASHRVTVVWFGVFFWLLMWSIVLLVHWLDGVCGDASAARPKHGGSKTLTEAGRDRIAHAKAHHFRGLSLKQAEMLACSRLSTLAIGAGLNQIAHRHRGQSLVWS